MKRIACFVVTLVLLFQLLPMTLVSAAAQTPYLTGSNYEEISATKAIEMHKAGEQFNLFYYSSTCLNCKSIKKFLQQTIDKYGVKLYGVDAITHKEQLSFMWQMLPPGGTVSYPILMNIKSATNYTVVPAGYTQEKVMDSYVHQNGLGTERETIAFSSKKGQGDILAKWAQLKPTAGAAIFSKVPSIVSPYSLGALNRDHQQDGLNAINFARYLADLPYNVQMDDALNVQAQHGAVLLGAGKTLSHTPAKPADMDDAFYKIGYKSTTSSNIGVAYGKDCLLSTAVADYLSDGGANNLAAVGHRRWILNPNLGKAGFGYVGNASSNYNAIQVFDLSGNSSAEYTAWPAVGSHPVELFRTNDPWSLSLNTEIYDSARTSDISVTLTDKNNTKQILDKSKTNLKSAYLSINTDNMGVPFAIIFRPMATYRSGDTYNVEVSGVYKRGAAVPVTLTYTVNFFSLKEATKPVETPTPVETPKPIETPLPTLPVLPPRTGVAPNSGETMYYGTRFPFDFKPILPLPAFVASTKEPYSLDSARGKNVVIISWNDELKDSKLFERLLEHFDSNVQVLILHSSDDLEGFSDFLSIPSVMFLRRKYPNWIELEGTKPWAEVAYWDFLRPLGITFTCPYTGSYLTLNSEHKRGIHITSHYVGTDFVPIFKDAFDIPVADSPTYEVDNGVNTAQITAGFREETKFTYTVDDPAIAKVSSTGLITGLKVGNTKVRIGARGAAGDFVVTVIVKQSKTSDLLITPSKTSALSMEEIKVTCKLSPQRTDVVPTSVTFDNPNIKYKASTQMISNPKNECGLVTGTLTSGNLSKTFTIDYVTPLLATEALVAEFSAASKSSTEKATTFSLGVRSAAIGYRDLVGVSKWTLLDADTGKAPVGITLKSVAGAPDSLLFHVTVKKNSTVKSIKVRNSAKDLTFVLPVTITTASSVAPVEKPAEKPAGNPAVTPAPAVAAAVPSPTKLTVNGKAVNVDAYNIAGNNYIKLRDMAYILNNTNKSFNVDWDGANNAIKLVSNAPYVTTPSDMKPGDGSSRTAKATTSTILLNGSVAPLTAYAIGDNNYFKLRDVMQTFDVGVGYDDATKTASLNTSSTYDAPPATVATTESAALVDGVYRIKAAANKAFELCVFSNNDTSGSGVALSDVADKANHDFIITVRDDGFYTMTARHSEMNIGNTIGDVGRQLQQNHSTGGKFKFLLQPDGSYRIQCGNGFYVGVENGAMKRQAKIVTQSSINDKSQLFFLEKQ